MIFSSNGYRYTALSLLCEQEGTFHLQALSLLLQREDIRLNVQVSGYCRKTRKSYEGTALDAAVASGNDQAAILLARHRLFKSEWLSEKDKDGKTVVELARDVGVSGFLTAIGQTSELEDVHDESTSGKGQCLIS